MNRLSPCGITAWSWVSALGKYHSESPGESLDGALSAGSLTSHEAELGIPGYSGRYPGALEPLPEEFQHRDSRCARLLWECLAPLRLRIDASREKYGAHRCALILGSSTGGIDATEEALRFERQNGQLPPAYSFVDVHPYDSLIELMADALGISGPALVVSTACSSAGKAMATAQRLIHAGQVDVALVGGADALCEMTVRGFSGLGVLSNDPCQPFGADRSGISIGEGAALLLLEGQSEAPIQLLGVGESSDAHHATAPHPEGIGAQLAMRACLEIAGVAPQEVGYLNAHGTGTEKNDAMEAIAISEVLGSEVSFSSTKNKTGHQLGTAGGTEAIVCIQAVAEGRAPQNIVPNIWDPDLAAQPQQKEGPLDVALSNSFAFGGSNVTVAVGRKRATASLHRPTSLSCDVLGAALWTPHYASLDAWLGRHKTAPVEKPPAEILTKRERGRASVLTRVFAELYGQLSPDGLNKPTEAAVRIPTVYSSRFGEMETTLKLLDQMDDEPRLSPIRFQASVHNTASGRISLSTKNRAFTTALAAGPESFSMALLEAQAWLACHGGEIMIFVAEEELPERLDKTLRFPAMGIGLHLAAPGAAGAIAQLGAVQTKDTVELPGIESGRGQEIQEHRHAPPAWALSLLEAVSERRARKSAIGPNFCVETAPP